MGASVKQYRAVKENLRGYLELCRSDKEKGQEQLFEKFGTKDRYEAATVVYQAMALFPIKRQQRIINTWAELQEYFDDIPQPGKTLVPMTTIEDAGTPTPDPLVPETLFHKEGY